MSLQTRLAQAAARDAATEWKQHMAMCPRCSRLRHHHGAEPCAAGAPLRDEVRRLRAQAQLEAKLDKAPNPDQEQLF